MKSAPKSSGKRQAWEWTSMIIETIHFDPRNTRKARKEERRHGAAISRSPTTIAPQAPLSIAGPTRVWERTLSRWAPSARSLVGDLEIAAPGARRVEAPHAAAAIN